MRSAQNQALTLGSVFLAVLLPIVFAFAAPASAQDTLTNSAGNVTLTAPCQDGTSTCSYTPDSGTPYGSGQVISVSVAPNSTFAGDSSLTVWECLDLDGTTANLPSSFNNNCDGNTNEAVTAINADGSIPAFDYTVYALPDSTSLVEKSNHLPACSVYPNDCVLLIAPNESFTAGTYLFSAAFQVYNNGSDDGLNATGNPGDGTPEVPLAIGLPLLAVAIGGGTLFLRRRRAHAA